MALKFQNQIKNVANKNPKFFTCLLLLNSTHLKVCKGHACIAKESLRFQIIKIHDEGGKKSCLQQRNGQNSYEGESSITTKIQIKPSTL
jgi:hypothetical protein